MVAKPAKKQIELAKKLRQHGEKIKILWSKTGTVSQIDGLITIRLLDDIEESVRNFLREYSMLFGIKIDLSDLKFIGRADGIRTVHIRYQQHHDGIPVLNAFTSVHLNKEHKIIKIKLNYHPAITLDTKRILGQGISKEQAIGFVKSHLAAETKDIHHSSANLIIYPKDDAFYLAWEVRISLKSPAQSHHIYVNVEDGSILNRIDVLKKKDGTGKVFIPNPVVALGDLNLTPDSDIPEKAYKEVILKELDGSGFLKGPYVDTGDTPNRAYETALVFNYKRGDGRFCEVMAYYHIDSCQRFIQSIGFNNICNKQIKVNAYASESYISYFEPHTKTLTFAAGGIPDAEDADIIVHEYAHALQDDQVPGFGMTDEGCAMGQGFGDFLAACFFAEENGGFNREAVGDWDGIGMIQHCVRRVDSKKHYPEDYLDLLRCDADSEIWSATLWDIYLAFGGDSKKKEKRMIARERSIKLLLESYFFLNPLSQFKDGADAIITANAHLFAGRDEKKIRATFIKRGIL
ncbi:Fungalysin metallopeptidase (M36) [uncultured archaeon]|nr:Fungalysin metallopeptidase (M36) [uncultured archaeon]